MDYLISRRLSSDHLYAYSKKRFWFWDERRCVWTESHLMSQKYEREHTARPTLTPEAFMTDLTKFQQLDEFELDSAMLDALKSAKPCKTAPIEPVKEERPTPSAQCLDAATAAESQTAASPAVPEVSSPTTETAPAAQNAAAPVSASEKNAALFAGSDSALNKPLTFIPENKTPAFDYSGLTAQTVENLHFAEDEYRHGKQMAERGLVHMGNAIAAAHDALCGVVAQCDNSKHGNRGDDTFRAWCLSIGITKDSAYRLLQVSALMDGSSPRQRAILESLPPTLLYAVAKPSAPPELVEKVKNGDITTNKQYQELLAQLKLADKRADDLQAHNDKLTHDYNDQFVKRRQVEQELEETRTRLKNSCLQEEQAHDALRAANSQLEAVRADVAGLHEQNTQLKERVNAAESREEEAWKLHDKAETRARNAEEALKKQPVTTVVDKDEVQRQAKALARQWSEEEIDRQAAEKAWGLADARNAELQSDKDKLSKDNAALRKQLAALRSKVTDDAQADFETANFCASLFRSAWDTCKGSYSRLTGEDLESTFQALCGTLNSIMEEASLLYRQPADYDGGDDDEPDVRSRS